MFNISEENELYSSKCINDKCANYTDQQIIVFN